MQVTPFLSAAVSSHVRVSLVLLPLLASNRASALDCVDDGENLLKVFAAQRNSYPINNWMKGSASACDDWEGVHWTTVDGVKRVISVNVEYSNLFGPIDWTALKAIDTLEVFIAGGNDFTGSLDLTQFPPLMTEFDVQVNQFSGDVDFSKLPQTIKYIDLAHNKLTGSVKLTALPKSFAHLLLSGNQFADILDLTGLAETGLTHVDATGNDFAQFHFPVLWPDTLASFMMKPTSGWDADAVCFLRAVESVGSKTDIPDLATQERRVCLETPVPVETEESMPQVEQVATSMPQVEQADIVKGNAVRGAVDAEPDVSMSLIVMVLAIVVVTAIAALAYSRHKKAAQEAAPAGQAGGVHKGNTEKALLAAARRKASEGGDFSGDATVVTMDASMGLDATNNDRIRLALDGDEGEIVAEGDLYTEESASV